MTGLTNLGGNFTRQRREGGRSFWRKVWVNRLGIVGVTVMLCFVVAAVFGSWIAPKPESTDGRREDSGRGVRELQARWPRLHWGRWEGGGRSSVAAQGPYGRLRGLRCAGW